MVMGWSAGQAASALGAVPSITMTAMTDKTIILLHAFIVVLRYSC
ncbi:hypothetical protein KL86DPRO_11138 [uncultured delta proteobacterium]|uniref:Uncharacterized protein n=1 Tax=uncultured delta proteobacterium TaxID=34034 RepID=A0A212JC61_9DELT|nr:hypothetical protein KL86DPRO_11138 [uncultured delta proteobacterium]